jgi:hypothetical protein
VPGGPRNEAALSIPRPEGARTISFKLLLVLAVGAVHVVVFEFVCALFRAGLCGAVVVAVVVRVPLRAVLRVAVIVAVIVAVAVLGVAVAVVVAVAVIIAVSVVLAVAVVVPVAVAVARPPRRRRPVPRALCEHVSDHGERARGGCTRRVADGWRVEEEPQGVEGNLCA